MRKINLVIVWVTLAYLLLAVIGNLYLIKHPLADNDKEYRVSVNRIERAIQEYENMNGEIPDSLEQLEDFSDEEYSAILEIQTIIMGETTVTQQKDFFSEEQNDYVIFPTEKCCYKIIYEVKSEQKANGHIFLFINVLAGMLYLFCLFLLLYIRRKILVPFHKISDIPYELAKGNLTIPLQENSDKAFGKFTWGMDLLREHLEEAKTRELALQKEKKVLLLSLSHDIKTPLSAIKLYSGALSKSLYKSEEKKIEIARNISDKVDEIEGYIAEIVKASNDDFLSFEVNNTELYIKEVLNRVEDYYTDKMHLNQIVFQTGNYSNCLVYGDGDRLEEVLQNVIENAIKYGDGRKIWIETLHGEEEYTISVRNTGCSLPDKELPHIFDSFFRGSNIEKKPGSGLGLYICRKLMHMMEGEIIAEIKRDGENRVMCVNIILRLA